MHQIQFRSSFNGPMEDIKASVKKCFICFDTIHDDEETQSHCFGCSFTGQGRNK